MRRSAGHQPPLVRYALPGAVVILAILTILPVRLIRFVGWFSDPVQVVVFPISGPLRALAGAIAPAVPPPVEDEEVLALRQRVDELQTLVLRRDAEIERLTRLIGDLQAGMTSPLASEADQLPARVVGVSSDLTSRILHVRAGRSRGVIPGVVATHGRLQQLVGRVEEADRATCRVRPITDRAAQKLGGVVMLAPDGSQRRETLLSPAGDGTLVGEVAAPDDPAERAAEVRPGMVVRLRDETWPAGAQMLRIGIVTDVTTAPGSALRQRIVVRPGEDLNRTISLRDLSELVLWIPRDAGAPTDGQEGDR